MMELIRIIWKSIPQWVVVAIGVVITVIALAVILSNITPWGKVIIYPIAVAVFALIIGWFHKMLTR